MLPDDYCTDLEQKARRYSGAYFGTCGSLAAGTIHLLKERRAMQATIEKLEDENRAIRDAVESRLEATAPEESEPECVAAMSPETMDQIWSDIRNQHQQLHQQIRDDRQPSESPARSLVMEALAAVEDRGRRYGPPHEHFARTVGMINALFAHKLREPLTPRDWAQIMMLDKLARDQERPVRDNQVDAVGYACTWAWCTSRDA